MSEPLDPCPFCKCENTGTGQNFAAPGKIKLKREIFVFCMGCQAKGPECETLVDAFQAWNRRTPSPVGTAPIEAARHISEAEIRQIESLGHRASPAQVEAMIHDLALPPSPASTTTNGDQ